MSFSRCSIEHFKSEEGHRPLEAFIRQLRSRFIARVPGLCLPVLSVASLLKVRLANSSGSTAQHLLDCASWMPSETLVCAYWMAPLCSTEIEMGRARWIFREGSTAGRQGRRAQLPGRSRPAEGSRRYSFPALRGAGGGAKILEHNSSVSRQ